MGDKIRYLDFECELTERFFKGLSEEIKAYYQEEKTAQVYLNWKALAEKTKVNILPYGVAIGGIYIPENILERRGGLNLLRVSLSAFGAPFEPSAGEVYAFQKTFMTLLGVLDAVRENDESGLSGSWAEEIDTFTGVLMKALMGSEVIVRIPGHPTDAKRLYSFFWDYSLHQYLEKGDFGSYILNYQGKTLESFACSKLLQDSETAYQRDFLIE